MESRSAMPRQSCVSKSRHNMERANNILWRDILHVTLKKLVCLLQLELNKPVQWACFVQSCWPSCHDSLQGSQQSNHVSQEIGSQDPWWSVTNNFISWVIICHANIYWLLIGIDIYIARIYARGSIQEELSN